MFDYKEAFSTPCVVHFDEGGGFTQLCDYFNVASWEETVYADIAFSKKRFTLAQPVADAGDECVFTYDKGILYRVLGGIIQREVLLKPYIYIHLQKRKMEVLVDSTASRYNIYPNAFVPYEQVTGEIIKENSKETFYSKELFRKMKMMIGRLSLERLKITYRNKKIKRRKTYEQAGS